MPKIISMKSETADYIIRITKVQPRSCQELLNSNHIAAMDITQEPKPVKHA